MLTPDNYQFVFFLVLTGVQYVAFSLVAILSKAAHHIALTSVRDYKRSHISCLQLSKPGRISQLACEYIL